ncbi:E3 SUMO-protein ligase ZNF451 isoform X2 [Sorex araneus]|uniref:E3 SUMO-protein ligase ZNF451 isoform X2 n=1 Tax=Sorex araneus TaxID=42254 RepID=UPI0003314447|nr:E3 SUMO-protein ligase ZNF451 isoform X2 [Sorex araneus]
MGEPGSEVMESAPAAGPGTSATPTTEDAEDDIQFVSEGPLRPVLEYIDLVSSDDEEPSTSHSDRMPESKVPTSENHRPEMCSICSVPLPIGVSSSSSGSCTASPQRIVSQPPSVENPLENQENDQNNSDNKISETETLKPSENFQTLPSSPVLVPQESLASSEVKENLPKDSSSASHHGQDAILYLQTQVAEMSRVIRDLQSRSCFRFHHSRPSENSSVPWDISTSKEENLSTVEEEADCKSPSADDKGHPADPSQSSFTGLLKRMEQRGVIKRVTLQSEAEACDGKPDYVTSKKRLVPPLHPLLRIATTEVFKDPADCHPSSFMGHRVYPVAKDTSPFQPNPPAEGPIVEALEHSKRGSTSLLDSTSKEMEVMGCRFYHAASIAARAASYMAYMTQYQRKLWEDMEDLVHDPEFDRGKARCIISDGMDAGLWQLCTTRDIMDSVVRVMAMSIDYRRQAWLRLTSLTKKTQEKISHLPFDGTSLFGQDVNAIVAEENSIKENDYKDHNKYYNQHRYFYSHDQKAHYHNRGYSKGDWYKPRNHPYRYRKKGESPERHGYKN